MHYKLLGQTGLRVAELCLGTMTFGEEWGWGASKDESKKIFDAYTKNGGNFIDTANQYTNGTSEKYIGDFINPNRSRFVIATKYTLGSPVGDPNAAGNHRKNLVQSLDASLKRLSTEYIDLLWVHCWDEFTPVSELMRALDDVVRAGKVLYIGISDAPAWYIAQANTLAKERGWTPFSAIQVQYSLIERTAERELIPMANALGLSITAWAPLGGGILTGKYGKDSKITREKARYVDNPMVVNQRALTIANEIQAIALEIGKSPSQVALAWLLHRPNVIPVVGARRHSQIEDSLGSLTVELSQSNLERLNQASHLDLGFPHDFLAAPHVRELVYGGLFESIINRR